MEASFLADARVDGKYSPSLDELSELLPKIDLKKEFENTKLVKDQMSGISFSFDSLRQSHLFALALLKKGGEKQLWALGPSDDFFSQIPLNDNRFDPILSMDENLVDGHSVARVYTRFNEIQSKERTEREERYTTLVREVVAETMPHLVKDVEDFRFENC
jgi:hypothetical protein